MNASYLWVGLAIGVGVGALIGSSKGRPGAGALLGLLGLIGWIIAALLPRKEQRPAVTPYVAGPPMGAMPPSFPPRPPAAGPPLATPQAPAGWYADPFQRHQFRYWDGATWSHYVSDGGVTGTDWIVD